jgi:glyoxylase-like metal-dependent hydrolase (beta-lactamase superfamily II)
MRNPLWSTLLALIVLPAALLAPHPAEAVEVRLAIVRTARHPVRESLLFAGGDSARQLDINFSAFLVQHGDTLLMFDTGLGHHVAAQYQQDMRWWERPFFRYEDPVNPVQAQLAAAGVGPVRQIVLSHTHWDHASGLDDFPGVPVWLPREEMALVEKARAGQRGAGSAWPSQVASPRIDWHPLRFEHPAHEGFEASHDLFGDGTVVFVPLFGHTPGSTGLFLRLGSGRQVFLVGDVVWASGALKAGAPKIWAARHIADHDMDQTAEVLRKIRDLQRRRPDLVVVPAHDSETQDALGYFPDWVR